MRGLLLKDMLNLRKSIWFMLGVVVIWSLCGEKVSTFTVFYLSYAVLSSTASADENCGWDELEPTLPLTSRESVGERYLLGAIFLCVGAVFFVIVRLALAAFQGGEEPLSNTIKLALSGVAVGFLINAILLPLQMKYGFTKSRIVCIIVFGVMAVILVILISLASDKSLSLSAKPEIVFPVMLVICALLDFISFLISVKIYEKREF